MPKDLEDRRVEITGPVDRKMVINALNSGARLLWRILKIQNSPTWENAIEGQINLRDAVKGTISHKMKTEKNIVLNSKTAVLIVRPRGWHLEENICKLTERICLVA